MVLLQNLSATLNKNLIWCLPIIASSTFKVPRLDDSSLGSLLEKKNSCGHPTFTKDNQLGNKRKTRKGHFNIITFDLSIVTTISLPFNSMEKFNPVVTRTYSCGALKVIKSPSDGHCLIYAVLCCVTKL